MSTIKLGSEEKQSGKVVYNAGIVKGIVALAVAEVEGTLTLPNNKNGITLFLEKDGIYADIAVVVEYGHDVPELAYRIQQSVKQSVENMTKYKVAKVDVHIQDVVFAEKKEEANHEEEEPAEREDHEKKAIDRENPFPSTARDFRLRKERSTMRNSAREAALNIIFAQQFNDECLELLKKKVYKQFGLVKEDDLLFAADLVATVQEHYDELIADIEAASHHYLANRMNPTDKSILLIAMAEIKYFDDIPPVVSVSEATGLARKYSTETSADFVNGVLSGVINK
ncbi:MAG: transcription antitermination factor NusB [Clostridia bacterium]|nr:transcription antitermination factor NusB [Clostridia bacterium]